MITVLDINIILKNQQMRKLKKSEKKAYPQFKKSKGVRLIRPLMTAKGNKSKYYLTADGSSVAEAKAKLENKVHPLVVQKVLKRGYIPSETFIY